MFSLVKKLKLIKKDLGVWSTKLFGNFKSKIDLNEHKLLYVEDQLLKNLDSPWFNSSYAKLIKQREKLLLFNQRY